MQPEGFGGRVVFASGERQLESEEFAASDRSAPDGGARRTFAPRSGSVNRTRAQKKSAPLPCRLPEKPIFFFADTSAFTSSGLSFANRLR